MTKGEYLMIYEYLKCKIDSQVAVVTIDRPPVNSLGADVFHELKDIFDELEDDPEVSAIVLTGNGEKAFVAGADIKEMMNQNLVGINQANKKARAAYTTVESVSKPVIAAINGVALGGGFELALACDVRISSEKAKFSFPEVGLGIIPGGGGTQRLQKIVGQGIAKELIYFGDMIPAERALELQLVNKVVPQKEVLSEAVKWAGKLAEKPAVALSMAKMAINEGSNTDLETGLSLEMNCFSNAFSSEDGKEGLHAFAEKRKPDYVGK